MGRRFQQVDVFSREPFGGNPVAVVVDAGGLDSEAMQRFARWTNLSETTFLLPSDRADYRLRIFTPGFEVPFAGHPTLGSCHAWLEATGAESAEVVQECGAGLVTIRRQDGRLAFAAPPLVRSGPVDELLVHHLAKRLGVARDEVVDAQWVDNGPGWVAVLLASADAVTQLTPGHLGRCVGVVGPCPPGSETAFEVRAFFPVGETTVEDPVTGSLNASLAQWLIGTGRATAPYIASQGAHLGRAGRVHITAGAGDTLWVGGDTVTRIRGEVDV